MKYFKLLYFLIFTGLSFLMIVAQEDGVRVETLTGPLNASGGVCVDADGYVYVADFGITLGNSNGTNVFKIDPHTGDATVFATGLLGASGNSFGPDGSLFQSNIAGGRISRITPDGQVSTFTSTNIFGPVGVAVDPEGNVFSTNCANANPSITKTTPAGVSTIFSSGPRFNCPNGLTIDDEGNLYTCNFGNGWVVKITPDGAASNLAFIPGGIGNSAGNNGHLTFANGKLYVVARCANQIFEVRISDGQATRLAGSGARGNQDGPALQATFSIPNGIRASRTGDTLYVNDAVDLTGGCFNGPLNPVVVRMIIGVNPTTGIERIDEATPEVFELSQNFPNPFNPATNIHFRLSKAESVSLVVYDLNVSDVATLVNEHKAPGAYEVDFDASNLASGVYIYRLAAGNFVDSKKMVLLR